MERRQGIYGGVVMPKYYQEKVAGYYLYYTKHCVIEAMHAHASDRKLTEEGSAIFFVKADGRRWRCCYERIFW